MPRILGLERLHQQANQAPVQWAAMAGQRGLAPRCPARATAYRGTVLYRLKVLWCIRRCTIKYHGINSTTGTTTTGTS